MVRRRNKNSFMEESIHSVNKWASEGEKKRARKAKFDVKKLFFSGG